MTNGTENDLVMDELVEAETPKEKKAPKKPALAENEIGASGVAAMLGVDPRTFRGFLRKNFRDMATQKGQRYKWVKGSAELQEVLDAYAAFKAKPKKEKKGAIPAEPATPAVPAKEVDVEEIDLD